MPAIQQLHTLLFLQLGSKHPIHCPVVFHVIQTVPVFYSKSGQLRGAQRRGLDAARPHHITADQIRLKLHQEVVCAGSSIHFQLPDVDAGIALHGANYIIGLVSQGFQCSADQVGTVKSSRSHCMAAPAINTEPSRAYST